MQPLVHEYFEISNIYISSVRVIIVLVHWLWVINFLSGSYSNGWLYPGRRCLCVTRLTFQSYLFWVWPHHFFSSTTSVWPHDKVYIFAIITAELILLKPLVIIAIILPKVLFLHLIPYCSSTNQVYLRPLAFSNYL